MTDVLEVVEPGLLLTVQDGGRPGLAGEGVTRGGAADTWSLAVANALVGNGPDAAALEATLLGPTLRALVTVTVGLAGTMAARVEARRGRIEPGSSVTLRAGETLVLEPAADGARAYLAILGGIDVPSVLGSRSTALGAGFGGLDGRALRPGDRLAARTEPGATPVRGPARWPGPARPVAVTTPAPLRVLPGPHALELGPDALGALLATAWTVSPTSNRVGLRLHGPALPAEASGDLASHGVVAGAVQVPPDRRPIVLGVDHQPTGGYPVVAVVITADLPRLGQLAPGAQVAFARVTPLDARAALADADAVVRDALVHLREDARWDDLAGHAGG